jgi:hypothetical protein
LPSARFNGTEVEARSSWSFTSPTRTAFSKTVEIHVR